MASSPPSSDSVDVRQILSWRSCRSRALEGRAPVGPRDLVLENTFSNIIINYYERCGACIRRHPTSWTPFDRPSADSAQNPHASILSFRSNSESAEFECRALEGRAPVGPRGLVTENSFSNIVIYYFERYGACIRLHPKS